MVEWFVVETGFPVSDFHTHSFVGLTLPGASGCPVSDAANWFTHSYIGRVNLPGADENDAVIRTRHGKGLKNHFRRQVLLARVQVY